MYEREFDQLAVISPQRRKLRGYIDTEALKRHEAQGRIGDNDTVADWMIKFKTSDAPYQLITPDTPLEELDTFLAVHPFAIVTDARRKFVMAIATREDLQEYKKRRALA